MSRRMEGETRVYDDHRDNLTVDVQNAIVQERAAQLRSADSHAAMLWNVFRSLQKLDPGVWLPRTLLHALGQRRGSGRLRALASRSNLADPGFQWWKRMDLPPGRLGLLREQAVTATLHLEHYPSECLPAKLADVARRLESDLPFEERVEVPLCIETPAWVLGVLAVYHGNLRQNTCFDSRRDELLRVLDAGSWFARERGKEFLTLVVYTDARTYNGDTKRLIDLYRGHGDGLAARLPHRRDRDVLDATAARIGELRWRDLGALLVDAKDEERIGLFDVAVIDELIKYLARKDVGFNLFRRLK